MLLVVLAALTGVGATLAWSQWRQLTPVRVPRDTVAVALNDPFAGAIVTDRVILTTVEPSGNVERCQTFGGNPFPGVVTPGQPFVCALTDAPVLQRQAGNLIVALPMEYAATLQVLHATH
jgi:hypothetical protein